jgi:PAS domain-containing protein
MDLPHPLIEPLRSIAVQARESRSPLTALLLHRTAEELILGEFASFAEQADRGYAAFDDLFDLAGRLGLAAYSTDADGYLTQHNKAAEAVWGWSPPIGLQRWGGACRLEHRDGRPRPMDASPMAITLRERRQVRTDTVLGWNADDQRLAMRSLAMPIRARRVGILGGVGLLLDVRERVALQQGR